MEFRCVQSSTTHMSFMECWQKSVMNLAITELIGALTPKICLGLYIRLNFYQVRSMGHSDT